MFHSWLIFGSNKFETAKVTLTRDAAKKSVNESFQAKHKFYANKKQGVIEPNTMRVEMYTHKGFWPTLIGTMSVNLAEMVDKGQQTRGIVYSLTHPETYKLKLKLTLKIDSTEEG